MNKPYWDGKDRRKVDSDLRDIIIETRNNVKHIADWSQSHDDYDNERFKVMGDRVSIIEKIAYSGIGGLAMLQIILHLIK